MRTVKSTTETLAGRNTHGHARELAVEVRNDLTDSLSGTCAAGNDVLGSGTTTTPILGRRSIDYLLSSSVGVNCGHETLNDGEVVVDNLGEWGQAVGCAGGVGEHLDVGLVVSLLTPMTNIGASAEGAEMTTFLAPPFKCALALSVVVNTPVDSTT